MTALQSCSFPSLFHICPDDRIIAGIEASMITSLGTCRFVIPLSELTIAKSGPASNAASMSDWISVQAIFVYRSLAGDVENRDIWEPWNSILGWNINQVSRKSWILSLSWIKLKHYGWMFVILMERLTLKAQTREVISFPNSNLPPFMAPAWPSFHYGWIFQLILSFSWTTRIKRLNLGKFWSIN